jgi:hypothetical protein
VTTLALILAGLLAWLTGEFVAPAPAATTTAVVTPRPLPRGTTVCASRGGDRLGPLARGSLRAGRSQPFLARAVSSPTISSQAASRARRASLLARPEPPAAAAPRPALASSAPGGEASAGEPVLARSRIVDPPRADPAA